MNYTTCKIFAKSISNILEPETIVNNIHADNLYYRTNIIINNTAAPQQETDIWNYILPILGVLIGAACTSIHHYFVTNKEIIRNAKLDFINQVSNYECGKATQFDLEISYRKLPQKIRKEINIDNLFLLKSPVERKKLCKEIIDKINI